MSFDVIKEKLTQLTRLAQEDDKNNKRNRQKELGKLSARERVDLLLDKDSFLETDLLAVPSYDQTLITDAVITGFGTINQRKVAVFAQDFSLKGGSLGKRHAEKIVKIMDLAAKIGCPLIALLDSGGARIDEGITALAGYGEIFKRNVRYSGVIPQISLILGPCAGGAVYSPALTDIICMVRSMSHMFITGPAVVEQTMHQSCTKETLGGTDVHETTSGVAHLVFNSEQECFEQVKVLLSYLPDNYLSFPPEPSKITKPHDQSILKHSIPEQASRAYDMKKIIETIVDPETIFELQTEFAPQIITLFARIAGTVIGIVANQPMVLAGAIDSNASCKGARFINLCNNFSIPVVTFVDVPGFLPGIEQEHGGIIRHGAKLLYAYAHATIPKITIIIRKAFGGAYIVMGSKELGADFNFSWPTGQIAVLGPQAARIILQAKKNHAPADSFITEGHEPQKAIDSFEAAYEKEYLNPFVAAQTGSIDAIIQPETTRAHLIQTLALCKDKVDHLPRKKSGSIPL